MTLWLMESVATQESDLSVWWEFIDCGFTPSVGPEWLGREAKRGVLRTSSLGTPLTRNARFWAAPVSIAPLARSRRPAASQPAQKPCPKSTARIRRHLTFVGLRLAGCASAQSAMPGWLPLDESQPGSTTRSPPPARTGCSPTTPPAPPAARRPQLQFGTPSPCSGSPGWFAASLGRPHSTVQEVCWSEAGVGDVGQGRGGGHPSGAIRTGSSVIPRQVRPAEIATSARLKFSSSVGSAMQLRSRPVLGSTMPIVPPAHPSSGIETCAAGAISRRLCALAQRSSRQSTTATGTGVSLVTLTASWSPGGGSNAQGPVVTAAATHPATTNTVDTAAVTRSRRRRRPRLVRCQKT
jgi:hypothetical protein